MLKIQNDFKSNYHYNDVIMDTSLAIVYSTVYSEADQRIHQSSVSLAFVRGLPAQMASNAENVSIWWPHHVVTETVQELALYIRNQNLLINILQMSRHLTMQGHQGGADWIISNLLW